MSEKCNQINVTIGRQSNMTVGFPKQSGINVEMGKSTQGGGSYPPLSEKPQINNITLLGNKTGAELYLQDLMYEITEQDIDKIIYGGM